MRRGGIPFCSAAGLASGCGSRRSAFDGMRNSARKRASGSVLSRCWAYSRLLDFDSVKLMRWPLTKDLSCLASMAEAINWGLGEGEGEGE